MSVNVWPLDNVAGDPEYAGRALRQTTGALWARDSSTRPLGARSGVVVGQGTCATIASTTWTIKPHVGVLDVESNAVAGPYAYAIDANITGTVTPDATLWRRDLISITLSDPAEDATSVPGAALTYTNGTPAGSSGAAVAPAAPARSMGLAVVLVPPTGGGAASITWQPNETAAAGGIIPVILGTIPTGYIGEYIYHPDDGLRYHDGTNWQPVTQKGVTSYAITAGNDHLTDTVSFDIAYTTAPILTATAKTGYNHSIGITAISTTGFTFRAFRTPGTNAVGTESAAFMWIAVPA